MTRYNKAIVAGVGFLATLLSTFGINFLEDPGLQNSIISLVTLIMVYFVPNSKEA